MLLLAALQIALAGLAAGIVGRLHWDAAVHGRWLIATPTTEVAVVLLSAVLLYGAVAAARGATRIGGWTVGDKR